LPFLLQAHAFLFPRSERGINEKESPLISSLRLARLHDAQTIDLALMVENFGCPDACFLEQIVLIEGLIPLLELQKRARAEDWDAEFLLDLRKVVDVDPEVPVM